MNILEKKRKDYSLFLIGKTGVKPLNLKELFHKLVSLRVTHLHGTMLLHHITNIVEHKIEPIDESTVYDLLLKCSSTDAVVLYLEAIGDCVPRKISKDVLHGEDLKELSILLTRVLKSGAYSILCELHLDSRQCKLNELYLDSSEGIDWGTFDTFETLKIPNNKRSKDAYLEFNFGDQTFKALVINESDGDVTHSGVMLSFAFYSDEYTTKLYFPNDGEVMDINVDMNNVFASNLYDYDKIRTAHEKAFRKLMSNNFGIYISENPEYTELSNTVEEFCERLAKQISINPLA